MKKMDRFEKIVEQQVRQDVRIASIDQASAVKLLRRQHAAYVRMVKRAMGHRMGAYVMLEDPGKMWISRTDLLAALAQYRKGTR